jgi:hypothetical protein
MWQGPGYEVIDPRPIAASAPYTYFLPSETEVASAGVGDQIQVTIAAVPPSTQWGAERLWFVVLSTSGEAFAVQLESEPSDIGALPIGSVIAVPKAAVIDVIFKDERPRPSGGRQYWDRCLVDAIVLRSGQHVDYIYREEPDTREGDRDPDSGWRIRASLEGVSAKEIEDSGVEYVALGKVLNVDDSWLHLIDAPVGSRFFRDGRAGEWIAEPT